MRPRPLQRRRRAGFTLIELLVAISILAMVAVLGWRGLDGIIRSRQVLTVQLEQSRGMQLAFAQMQSDLEHLSTISLLHSRPNLMATTDALTLVRTVFADAEAAQVQVVAYRIRDGVLTRRESVATRDLTLLDATWLATIGDTDAATSVALEGDVSGMSMRLFQSSNGNSSAVSTSSSSMAWATATGAMIQAGPGLLPVASSALVTMPIVQSGPSGLEVTLQQRGQTTALVKLFLLGAI